MKNNILTVLTLLSVLSFFGCEPPSEPTAQSVEQTAETSDLETLETKGSQIMSENQNANDNANVNPTVKISTSKGDILVELNPSKAPITCANFLSYVKSDFFSGTIFHRVIKGFMVQGGGMTADMQQKKTNAPIKLESNNGLKNTRGTIAMARTGIPDSATSQFFINHADNDFLNYGTRDEGYAVFGKVIEGMDVVDAIAEVKTHPGDVPVETITINSITLVDSE